MGPYGAQRIKREARHGKARYGAAGLEQGMGSYGAWNQESGMAGLGLARREQGMGPNGAWNQESGRAWLGQARRGPARQGKAWAPTGQRIKRGAWLGWAWRGQA